MELAKVYVIFIYVLNSKFIAFRDKNLWNILTSTIGLTLSKPTPIHFPPAFFYIKDRIHKLPGLLAARGAHVHGRSWKRASFSK